MEWQLKRLVFGVLFLLFAEQVVCDEGGSIQQRGTLIKCGTMCVPMGIDAFTALCQMGGCESSKAFRREGCYKFKRPIGPFADFRVVEFAPKVPILDHPWLRGGQARQVVSSVVTNLDTIAEGMAILRPVKKALEDQPLYVVFKERQGSQESGFEASRPGREGWNISLSAKRVPDGRMVLEMLLWREFDVKREINPEVQVEVDI